MCSSISSGRSMFVSLMILFFDLFMKSEFVFLSRHLAHQWCRLKYGEVVASIAIERK